MLLIYILIGLVYTVINGSVRKIDTDGDWMLPLVWWGLWPLCLTALLVGFLQDLWRKHKI